MHRQLFTFLMLYIYSSFTIKIYIYRWRVPHSLSDYQIIKMVLCEFPTITITIWNLEPEIWDLELWIQIWVSGSGTWDLGFEDLGLGIWDIESFWPTDPFDQLGVAQLSKIFCTFNYIYILLYIIYFIIFYYIYYCI